MVARESLSRFWRVVAVIYFAALVVGLIFS